MTQIVQNSTITTLINVFTVTPEKQQLLVDELVKATEMVINKFPGFISANIHKSLDGTHVVNYAQWRSQEDFQAMLADPDVIPHLRQAAGVATSVEPLLYEVISVEEAPHKR